MSSSSKQKTIDALRKGYTPVELSPKANLTNSYKNLFKPLVNRKDFNTFFELFETDDVILRAWSFLGIHHVLEENSVYQEDRIEKIQDIILKVLKDERDITYYGGSAELRTTLREHHVRRVCELDPKLNLKPALEYCSRFEKMNDSVVSDLIENIISKSADENIESLILRIASNTSVRDFHLKNQMVKSFENLSDKREVKNLSEITTLFKTYLKQIKENKITDQDFLKSVKSLQETIFRVGAILGLAIEEETLEFINSLKYPYSSLDLVAKRYENNEKFVSTILTKLKETKNPNFIAEILKAILVLKDKIDNWKEIIIENVKEFHIVDGFLIEDMQESNLINPKLILDMFNEGGQWSLEFIREFFDENSNLLEEWSEVKREFVKILEMPVEETNKMLLDKKEMIFKLIIDLQEKNLINYCLNNFKSFKDNKLKKLAVFPILKFGEDKILKELKEEMKKDADMAKFVLNFIDSLNRNEWKFFY
ncbi:MAG: hypothetical protein KGD73_01980 [Candidatus Lokiarchaeota archaeon]|nr:hypothetical protein [Candidatus Lokiarchaeota archaeon]